MIRFFTRQLTKRYSFCTYRNIETEQTQDITIAFFYRRLLRNTRVKENGNSKFNPFDLHTMAKLAEQPQQSDLLLEAYYNLLGHNTNISQKTSDIVVQRCIQINQNPQKVLDLYQKHYLLRYFPHYNTTNKLLERVSNQQQHFNRFLNIIYQNPFIKIDNTFVAKTLEILSKEGIDKRIQRFYKHLLDLYPQTLELTNVISHLDIVPKLKQSQAITKFVNSLSNSNQDIHKRARFYIRLGKNIQQVIKQLSKLSTLDLPNIENTFEGIENRLKSIYTKKPQVYAKIVQQYNSLLKSKNKSESLLEIQNRILSLSDENQATQEVQEESENK